MTSIDVRCVGSRAAGWSCRVDLAEGRRPVSTHDVHVRAADLDRLAPGASDPTDLVERSFAFLLEREPAQSILGSFELPVIGRYFSEYETAIRRARRPG